MFLWILERQNIIGSIYASDLFGRPHLMSLLGLANDACE